MKIKIIITFYLSLFFGLHFPDIDLSLMFILNHRSIITHGIILPFIFNWYLVNKTKIDRSLIETFYSGILLGISIHLIADLIPKAYIGYALIKLPLNISIGKELSILWMATNVLAGLIIASNSIFKLKINKYLKLFKYLLSLLIGVVYMLNENDANIKIFILFIISTLIGFRIYKKNNAKQK